MHSIFRVIAAVFVLGLCSWGLLSAFPALRYDVDGDKLSWIGRQLAAPPRQYDTIFVGSSHMWNAVDPVQYAAARGLPPGSCANLAVNWSGRDVHTMIARDFVKRHRVRQVVVECLLYEEETSHHWFPHLATASHVLEHATFRNLLPIEAGDYRTQARRTKDALGFLAEHMASLGVRGYLRLLPSFQPQQKMHFDWDASMGFRPMHLNLVHEPLQGPWRTLDGWHDGRTPYTERTNWGRSLALLSRECRASGTSLLFLFLPPRERTLPNDDYLAYLRTMGEVRLFPPAFMEQASLWWDKDHLNARGARQYTAWAANALQETGEGQPGATRR